MVFSLLREGTDVPPKVSESSHPGAERRAAPHPRAAVSGRMSAADFRAMQGRSGFGTKAATRPRAGARESQPVVAAPGKSLRAALRRAAVTQAPSGKLRELPVEISLPFLPPSINSLFATVADKHTGRERRVLSAAARKARRAIATFISGHLSRDEIYELHITVELPALTLAGKLRKVDLTNRVKFLEDCVSQCLGIDDRQFFRVILDKVHAEHERTIVRILKYRNRPERGRRAEDASVARGARTG